MNKFFSVDTEFSGLNNLTDSLLSVGIVAINYENNIYSVNEDYKLYLEIQPTTDHYDADSMHINGLDFDELKRRGLSPIEACNRITSFLNLQSGDNAVFVAYCGVLDKIFFDQLFTYCDKDSPFNYEIIEISSLAIGKLGLSWGFSEVDLEQKLGIEPMSNDKKHNALEDAIHQAEEFVRIMNS